MPLLVLLTEKKSDATTSTVDRRHLMPLLVLLTEEKSDATISSILVTSFTLASL